MPRRRCRSLTVAERYSIGVDIGGTFTDLVMLDAASGRLYNEKVLTTPHDPSLGVLEGVDRILAANGATPGDVRHVIHGTTLVANAVIERRGSRVALVTTRGFADLLEIGTEWRYDIYDLSMQVPEPLVPRRLRFEVPERIGPDGHVLQALDETEAVAVARRIAASGVAAVAISMLHAFRNPDHERRMREIIRREAPGIVVCISSDVVPEIGEYERTSTTVCNAYVLPVFESYLRRLTQGLRSRGVRNDLYLMLSDGGTVHESTAAAYPVRLVQSGPAGGVQAISAIGAAAGERNLLCFDMGGTTAKACLVDDGKPLRTTEFEVARVYRFKRGSGLPLRVPVIEMIEIGAGGGSISRVDHLGLVQVGPESSSADPGPACYGRGGQDPTVTDADLVLGYLSADSFLGGDMRLDVEAGERALERAVARPLGISVLEAAWAIHETVNENMAQAASMHALEKARRITDYVMVPIGGAGPVHACNIALKLGLPRVLCPLGAGVASAQGFLVAPASFTLVRGGVVALDEVDWPALRASLAEMQRICMTQLEATGETRARTTYVAAIRYVGQGYDVDVPLEADFIDAGRADAVRAAFERAYRAQFGRVESDMLVEIVSWRLTVAGPPPQVDLVAGRRSDSFGDGRRGSRRVYFGPATGFVETPVYDRYHLAPGSRFAGPAVFEERESTTVVPPGATARIDDALNLLVDLPAPAAAGAPR
jgi:N-methylhydantoinase A